MRKSITISAVMVIFPMAVLLPTTTTSSAQAGSTGGTLGKTDKSASGGEEPSRSRNPSRRAVATKQAGSDCNSLAGTWEWKWGDQTGMATFHRNGTGTNSNGDQSTWTCTGRTVVMHWRFATDTLVLSSDGKKLTGSNNYGATIAGSRL